MCESSIRKDKKVKENSVTVVRIDTREACGPVVVNCIGSDLIPSPNPIFDPVFQPWGKPGLISWSLGISAPLKRSDSYRFLLEDGLEFL